MICEHIYMDKRIVKKHKHTQITGLYGKRQINMGINTQISISTLFHQIFSNNYYIMVLVKNNLLKLTFLKIS